MAMAQVKTCSSSTSMPSRCSLVATSRRVRWLLLVRNRNGTFGPAQFVDEAVGTGDQVAAAVDDAIHVDQISKHAIKFPRAVDSVRTPEANDRSSPASYVSRHSPRVK